MQIVGGEQTLFVVTAEGKVCLFVLLLYCLLLIQTLLLASYSLCFKRPEKITLNFSAVNTRTLALLTSLVVHCFVQVYATGYGHGGRLGLGGTETVTSVRLIESLQHVVIKKVAVHSGGKHAMALSMDGDVYSWGEGEDGKLGHGSRG